jgi:hypothetical protein
MHGGTNFAHGYSAEQCYLNHYTRASASSHFEEHFRPLSFAGAKYYRSLRQGSRHAGTSAMTNLIEAEAPTAQLASHQAHSGCGND